MLMIGFVCRPAGVCCVVCVFLYFSVAYPCVGGVVPQRVAVAESEVLKVKVGSNRDLGMCLGKYVTFTVCTLHLMTS
jgi:hypothetical protein